jgi:hypothetical protein
VCEVSTHIRFDGEQVEYGGRYVLFRVGCRRGGVDVAKTVVGVGGGGVEGVSDFTSRFCLAGSVPRLMDIRFGELISY